LNSEEQRTVIAARKKVVSDLRQKSKGKKTSKKSTLWKKQSEDFRDAMRTNRLISKAEQEGKPPTYYLK
jgi:hypothetical protein